MERIQKRILSLCLTVGVLVGAATTSLAANVPGNSGLTGSAGQQVFTDVTISDYYANAVAWAVGQGITTGETDTLFGPNSTCTTGQILTFLWRAQGSPEPTISNPFSDVTSGDYYAKAAIWAYQNDLVSGTTFSAATPCTRSQTVTYLWKLAGKPMVSNDVYPVGGFGRGGLHDVVHNRFFDFTIHGAQLLTSYEGYTPGAGKALLVVNLTIKNTDDEAITMFDEDFQAQWGDDADDAYAYPILQKVSAKQLPELYDLDIAQEVTGDLVYEVPVGRQEFSIWYEEYFVNGAYGDLFCVNFGVKDGKTTERSTFADVSDTADYMQAVEWAVKRGITSGTSATEFGPDATCTRGQIVTFLYQYYKA